MAQEKMRYGIDLGTTNSSICRIEGGEPAIKKTDTLKDTLPSCVAFTRKKIIRTGDSAYNNLRQDKARATKTWDNSAGNVFIEFKRTMGLDKEYYSSYMGRSFSSEELSAEILKSLKSFISDENVEAAVITIPAKFKTDQIAATKRAAELAGIKHCELLQEPIAASIAYGLNADKNKGIWVVFDFGGGTFDAALLEVSDGIIQVKDTEGDNYLGGKNLDYAIVDQILIPHLQGEYTIDEILSDEERKNILRDALKFYAEQIKNQLSFNEKTDVQSQLDEFGEDDYGEAIDLDIVVTKAELEQALTPIFQKAIDITLDLIHRNGLKGDDVDSLVLVGGPTYSPILRDMLRKQVTSNVDSGIDPMTAVAKGAALFASNIDSTVRKQISAGTVALDISYQANSVEPIEYVSIRLIAEETKGVPGNSVLVELTRGDKAWSSGKLEVTEEGNIFECQLVEGRSNSFAITAFDLMGNPVPCFPSEINIMQGMVVGNAVLPYNIGIEAHNESADRDEFVPLKGLEKNQSLPAVGVRNELKNPKQLRPGNSEDRLIIPIYQGEINSAGTSAIFNDHVFDLIITGDDVTTRIPADSNVDLTLKVDASQMLHAEIYFPAVGETIEKDIQVEQRTGVEEGEVSKFISLVEEKLDNVRNSDQVDHEEFAGIENAVTQINNRWSDEIGSEDGRMHLLADIRREALKLEKIERNHEWDTVKGKLEELLAKTEQANNELGNQYDSEVASMKRQVNQVIRQKDIKAARLVHKQLDILFFGVTMLYQLIGLVKHYSRDFNQYTWKDRARAQDLLAKARTIIQNNPSKEELLPLVRGIYEVLDVPEDEKIKF